MHEYAEADSRYLVILDSGAEIMTRAEKMRCVFSEDAEDELAAAEEEHDALLEPGTRVVIQHLKSSSKFNGQIGTVRSPFKQTGDITAPPPA